MDPMTEWQPIETAPKDGTNILWCSEDRKERCVIHWPTYSDCFDEGYWQPLPTPPELHPGCGSAITPCDHQRSSPYTICDVCKKAAGLPE